MEEEIKQQIKKEFRELLEKRDSGLLTSEAFIEAVGKQAQKIIAESMEDVPTLKKNIETLQAEIKSLRQISRMDANLKILDPLYNGPWGSVELAHDVGMYTLASVLGSKKAKDYLVSKGYVLKDMSLDENATGALLAPTQVLNGMIMLIERYGLFRRNALVQPMASDSATGIKYESGLTVYCPGEGVAPDKSDPSFRTVGLSAKEWVTYTAIDRTLNEDAAIAIGNLIGELIALAFAQKEDEVGLLGDGTSDYFNHVGVMGAFDRITTPAGVINASGNAWSAIVLDDFLKLQAAVHSAADVGDELAWIVSRPFYYNVMRRLALAAGGVYAAEIQGNDVNKERRFLQNRLELTPVMPKASASGQRCCLYGNLRRAAILGDRRQVTIEQSREALFLERQIAIMGTERVAFTVYGCGSSTAAGTIVAMKTT